jgi:hypothetical protein
MGGCKVGAAGCGLDSCGNCCLQRVRCLTALAGGGRQSLKSIHLGDGKGLDVRLPAMAAIRCSRRSDGA